MAMLSLIANYCHSKPWLLNKNNLSANFKIYISCLKLFKKLLIYITGTVGPVAQSV